MMMQKQSVDLEAYFKHIGYDGDHAASLETLRHLHARHTETIPFENLSPLLGGSDVKLDIDSLRDKLVRRGRGGYCYEQNLLLLDALNQLGFTARGLAARVLWNIPEGVTTPRSHMLILVTISGEPFIADVGFGGNTLTGPVRLIRDIEQDTPHEPFRLLQSSDVYTLQTKLSGNWKSLYAFDLQPQHLADYEVSSWYLSHFPQSFFLTNLVAGRPELGRRHTLLNNKYTIYAMGGEKQSRTILDVPELRTTLESAFRIRLPVDPQLDDKLRPFLEQPNPGDSGGPGHPAVRNV